MSTGLGIGGTKFSATYLYPPEYKQAAKTLAEKGAEVRLAKVNAMEEMELAKRFEIRGFPTLKYFKHGVIPRDYQGPRKAEVSHDSGYSSLIRRIQGCKSSF